MDLDLETPPAAEGEAEPTDAELAAIENLTPEERLAVLEAKFDVQERRFARAMMEVSSAIGRRITGDPPDPTELL